MIYSLGLPWIIEKYFFSGYTFFNTLFYGFLLIFILFFILKLFKKLDINPSSIIFSIIHFILFGSTIRALVDNNILPYNVFLITPGIYFVVGFITIFTFILAFLLFKKMNFKYEYMIFLIGLLFASFPLFLIPYFNFKIASYVLVLWALFSFSFLLIGRFWDLYKNKINLSIISAHLFDATSTFIGVDYYGYYEQHVLPKFIYNISSSAITMYPLKIAIITIGLFLIDRYIDDEKLNGLLKLTLFVLGLAPGLRNFLTMCI